MVNKTINVIANFTQKGLKNFKKNIDELNVVMAKPIGAFREAAKEEGGWNKMLSETQTKTGKAALGLRKATHGMRGFRMEMLGVMFFGMAMQRMFGGLLKTSLEWTGIMELLSATLGVLFLPVALELLEAFLPISEWLMNLSDNTKLWIGWIVVLGFIIGSAIMIIGQLALGIGSLILVFGGFSVAGILTGLGAVIGIIALAAGSFFILKGLIGGFDEDFDDSVANWQANGGTMEKVFGGIVRTLHLGGSVIQMIFKNIVDIVKISNATIALTTTKMIYGVINLFIRLWNWMKKIAAGVGGNYTKTAYLKADTSAYEATIAKSTQDMAYRTAELIDKTPTTKELFTGSDAKSGTSITNNFNGFTKEDLLKELDSRDKEMVSQMERER